MEDDTVPDRGVGRAGGKRRSTPDAIHVQLTPGEGDDRRISIRLPAQIDLSGLDLGVQAE